MTDTEIIKALECCVASPFCGKDTDCPYKGLADCHKKSTYDAIDLINRLKAELDESREKNAGLALALLHEVVNEDEQLRNEITKVAKSEAYKEFAERVAPIIEELVDIAFSYHRSSCVIEMCKKSSEIACGSDVCINENKTYWKTRLDNLLKEMG